MQRINVRLDQRVKEELEAEVKQRGVSPSDIVRQALDEHLRQRTPRETCSISPAVSASSVSIRMLRTI